MARSKGTVRHKKCRKEYTTIPIARLQPGTVIRSPIYDDRDECSLLLLSAGTRITPALLEKIRRRGIESVRIQRDDLARMEADRSRRRPPQRPAPVPSEEEEAARTEGSWGVGPRSFLHKVKRHGAARYEPKLVSEFASKFQSSLSQTSNFFQELTTGGRVRDKAVTDISQDSVIQIAKDSELFVSLGITPRTGEYPMQHSLQSSMLAMSIGTTLGLSQDELIELGTGCLLHDLGMLRIDRRIYESASILDPIQFLEITKHPTYTFEMIREMDGLPIGSRMVAYQTHERCNGSGYPRKRKKSQIHYLARIAAVADAFVAMISPRPYRPAYIPYHALEEIIRGTRSHLFDPEVVRALLHTISLFPIGSYVQMSDGRVGKVIRANGEKYTQPVVELWHPDNLHGPSETVDLTQTPELTITAPLSELESPELAEVCSELNDGWE